MQLDLTGRHAVVLGESRGLGLATAQALGGAGARVTVVSRPADRTTPIQPGMGADLVEAAPADLIRPEDLHSAVQPAQARFDLIETLVIRGGGPPPGTFQALSDGQRTAAFEPLLLAPVRAIRDVLPDMQAQTFGRIIIFLSTPAQSDAQ